MQIKNFLGKRIFFVMLLAAILCEILYVAYLTINLQSKNIPAYMCFYGVLFLVYLFAVLFIKRRPTHLHEERLTKNKLFLLVLIGGIVFRATLIPSQITTSDDVYRYVWEGKVLCNGYNPYQHAPSDTALSLLHSKDLPAKVTFKNNAAIYPPVAQILFAANYLISGEKEYGLKLFYLIFEIITMIFIALILKERRKDPALIVYYAWLPLPVMEFFVNVHVDPVGIAFFVMFLYFIIKDNIPAAALSFAFSFLAKLYPVFILPLIIKKIGFKKTVIFGAIIAAVIICSFLPFIPRNRFFAEFLFKYLANWQFNGSFYNIFQSLLHDGHQAKLICNVLLIVSIIGIAIFYKDFLRAVCFSFIAVIAFTATIYPWYLGWVAAINPVLGLYSVTWLFFTVNLSNFTPLGPVWKEYSWVLLVEYIPFYLLLGYDFFYKKINE